MFGPLAPTEDEQREMVEQHIRDEQLLRELEAEAIGKCPKTCLTCGAALIERATYTECPNGHLDWSGIGVAL